MSDYHPPALMKTIQALKLAGVSYRAMVPVLNEVFAEELIIPLNLSSLYRLEKQSKKDLENE